MALRTAALGEPVVQFAGDPEKIVSRIGIGAGCGCDPGEYARLGCDLFVVCDDGTAYWAGIQRSVDAGFPVVRVNHGTSEEPGMVTLALYLQETFPEMAVSHLPQAPCYQPVGEVEG